MIGLGTTGTSRRHFQPSSKRGGRAIVVDDNPEAIEGQWHGSRVVVLEFDSVEAARSWYQSPEYQAVIGERHASTEANAAIVSGFEMPGG